jgi:integrase
MSLKLCSPIPGKTKNYRIRGSHLRVRVDRSAGTADKALAGKVLKEVEREIEDDFKRGRNEPVGPTFAGAVTKYINMGGEKRFLMPLLDHFGKTPMSQITQESIDEAALLLYPNTTPSTRNRQVYSPISAVLKANRVNMPIIRPKGSRGATRTFYFEPREVERLIAAASEQNREFGLLLLFLLCTGLRLSEALSLQVRHLSLEDARAYVEKTKNGLPRTVHLPPQLVAAMANHPRGYDREGRVFRFSKCSRLYQRLQDAADSARVIIPDRVAFHALRHTYGAYMRRYGDLDTSGLVAAGAWRSHDAARRYEHLDVNAAAKASDAFPVMQKTSGPAFG